MAGCVGVSDSDTGRATAGRRGGSNQVTADRLAADDLKQRGPEPSSSGPSVVNFVVDSEFASFRKGLQRNIGVLDQPNLLNDECALTNGRSGFDVGGRGRGEVDVYPSLQLYRVNPRA